MGFQHTTTRAVVALTVALGGALVALGCETPEKIDGRRFDLEISARGREKRFLSISCAVEASNGPRSVEIVDVTSIDDDAAARRKLRIEPGATPGEARPGAGHVEFATVAVRPIDLVIAFRGHEDIFHLSFPSGGGVTVEPSDGEFSHVTLRGGR